MRAGETGRNKGNGGVTSIIMMCVCVSLSPHPPIHPRYKAFYRIWSVKEAYIKATGHGLHFPIARLECHVTDKGAHSGLAPEDELFIDGCPTKWKFFFFTLEPSYVWCTALGTPNGGAFCGGASTSSSKARGGGGSGAMPGGGVDLDRFRSDYHVLKVKDCLPSELLAQYEALGRAQQEAGDTEQQQHQ